MRELWYESPGTCAWRDAEEPTVVDPTQAVVRMLAVACCDLDVATVQGRAPLAPGFRLGHEGVGEVVARGEEVTGVGVCDRVVVPFQLTLPDGLDPVAAASLSDNVVDGYRCVGPYRDEMAELDPVDRRVLVAMALAVGLYATATAIAYGMAVDSVDTDPERLRIAEALGASAHERPLPDPRWTAYPVSVRPGRVHLEQGEADRLLVVDAGVGAHAAGPRAPQHGGERPGAPGRGPVRHRPGEREGRPPRRPRAPRRRVATRAGNPARRGLGRGPGRLAGHARQDGVRAPPGLAAVTSPPPPDGFARHFRQSPLTDPWEPLYSRRDGERFLLGVRLDTPHTNSRGLAHGGLLSALADNAMGLACVLAMRGEHRALTAQMSLEFLGVAAVGAWLEVAAEPVRLGRTLSFAEARLAADGQLVAKATAVFRMTAPHEG